MCKVSVKKQEELRVVITDISFYNIKLFILQYLVIYLQNLFWVLALWIDVSEGPSITQRFCLPKTDFS